MSVDLPYPGVFEPKLLKGVIVNTPAHAGDVVFVRIDSYGTQDTWPVVHWDPHGNTLPAAGASCLVGIDEENGRWVLSWVGAWS